MQLTEQQLSHFQTFGFLIFRQLLTPQETAQYSLEFNRGLDAWLNGGSHDGKTRHYATLMEAASPFIAGLADDPRFLAVAQQLLGKPVLGIAVDGNYMVGDTLWHPDTGSLDYTGVKFCIYPDPLDGGNGALRVVPGSHQEPFHSRVRHDTQSVFGVAPDQLPVYIFASQPGDVLVFNVALWHGAFGGGHHRRQGVVVYYEDPTTTGATTAIQAQMRGNHQHFAKLGRRMYGDHWRASRHSEHQRWLRRLDELGVLETPGVQ